MVSHLDAMKALQERAHIVEMSPETTANEVSLAVKPDNTPIQKPEPILSDDAFYGVAGEIVGAIEPHTEADPAALLVTFLAMAGNAIGRDPHAVAEAARHGANLFAIIVGDTAKGRKGSSYQQIRELFSRADPIWATNCISGGLSSGEGLIWQIRDAIEKLVPLRDNGKQTGEYETVVTDEGVTDKRLMVIEGEFASVLKNATRETNNLSATIRQAWDYGDLRTLTKNSPAKATDAHISMVGHVTQDELLRYLSDTEAGNGFANRILFTRSKRSRILPEGGGEVDYTSLVPVLVEALERARSIGQLKRDEIAREMWAEIYEELSSGKGGLLGSVIARAEAQVLRLSVLYAALDGDDAIRPAHLMAALAVWDYCEASAAYIFGDATGDPLADRILESLRATGELSRTNISGLLGRNIKADRISQALDLLLRLKKARREIRDSDGARPVEVWIPI